MLGYIVSCLSLVWWADDFVQAGISVKQEKPIVKKKLADRQSTRTSRAVGEKGQVSSLTRLRHQRADRRSVAAHYVFSRHATQKLLAET